MPLDLHQYLKKPVFSHLYDVARQYGDVTSKKLKLIMLLTKIQTYNCDFINDHFIEVNTVFPFQQSKT